MNSAPAKPSRPAFFRWKLLGACCLIGAFLIPLPAGSRQLDRLYDLSHLLIFGGVAFFLMGALPRLSVWRRTAITLFVVFAFGVAIEVIQPYFGRRASLHDVVNDLIGGVVGILIALAFRWIRGT